MAAVDLHDWTADLAAAGYHSAMLGAADVRQALRYTVDPARRRTLNVERARCLADADEHATAYRLLTGEPVPEFDDPYLPSYDALGEG